MGVETSLKSGWRFEIASTTQPLHPLQRLRDIAGSHAELLSDRRVALKPNLTWLDPRPGVTTSHGMMAQVATALSEAGNEVLIVESNGGYGTFDADAAFDRHGLRDLAHRVGGRVVNLSAEPTIPIQLG